MRKLLVAAAAFGLLVSSSVAQTPTWLMITTKYEWAPNGTMTGPSEPIVGEIAFGPYTGPVDCADAFGLVYFQTILDEQPVSTCELRQ